MFSYHRYFELNTGERVPFIDAKSACEAQGGLLAEPRDDQQFDLLLSFSMIVDRFWLGGQDPFPDPGNQNIIFLSDNTSVPLDSGFWGPIEPNNVENDEYCLEYLIFVDGLNDESCLTRGPFVCEFGAHGPNVVLC